MSEQTTSDETKQAKAEAATLIADQLGESESVPRKTVERCVKILGIEMALAYLKRTQEIEAAGGMMLPDGSRRRTPGGVYFYLIRKEVEPKQRVQIFPMQQKASITSGTSAAPQPAAVIKMIWAERGEVLDKTEQE